MHQILTAGRHMVTPVDETLDIRRIEAGELQLDRQPARLASNVQSSLDMMAPLVTAHGLLVRVDAVVLHVEHRQHNDRLPRRSRAAHLAPVVSTPGPGHLSAADPGAGKVQQELSAAGQTRSVITQ